MTFQQFRYLLEIAKHPSISKAATALFVTQPSISKAIHELEKELNITIFNRTNKGVVFTKDGHALLAHAKVLLEQTEAIRYRFDTARQHERQTYAIQISTNESVLETFSCLNIKYIIFLTKINYA